MDASRLARTLGWIGVAVLALVLLAVLVPLGFWGRRSMRSQEEMVASIKASAQCSDADTLERRCGSMRALSSNASATVLMTGHDQLQLQAFAPTPPRSRTWKVTLPFSRDDHHRLDVVVQSRDGKYVAAATNKGAALFDGASGTLLRTIERCDPPDPPNQFEQVHGWALAFTPDGKRLVTAQRSLCLLDLGPAKQDERLPSEAANAPQIFRIALDPSGERAWLQRKGRVDEFSLSQGRQIRTLNGDDSPHHFALSSDGERVATIGYKQIEVWDARTGERLRGVETRGPENGNPLQGPLTFLPGGRHLVVLSSYGYYVVDTDSGEVSKQQRVGRSFELASIGDGQLVLSGNGMSGDTAPTVLFLPPTEVLLLRGP
jgi:WD40 repeat protein